MQQSIKKIWNGVTTLLVGLMMILAMLLVGMRLFGFEIYTVLSGSMEPEYHTGALIYVRATDPETLEVGDVITFRIGGGTVATHRIIEIVEDDNHIGYRTKGDANDVADGSLVAPENIIGKPVFTVSYLGYLAQYIQSPAGRYAAFAVGAFLLLLLVLPDLLFDGDKKQKEKSE